MARDVAIEVEIDEAAGKPGYARIYVPNADSAGEGASFRLQRLDRSHDSYLGPNGWQSGATDLVGWKTEADGIDLVIHVGPEVVDRVPNDVNVAVSVPAAEVAGVVFWPDLPMSGVLSGSEAAATRYRPPAPEPAPKAVAAQAPEAKPEPGPGPEPEARPQEAGTGAGTAAREPETKQSGLSPALLAVLALLFVGALGAAAYFLLSRDGEPTPVAETETEAEPDSGDGSSVAAVPPQEEAAGPGCDEPYAYAAGFKEDNPQDASAWYAEGEALLEGDCPDAGALLLVEAADGGNGEALHYMARLADPLVEREDRLLFEQPDAATALQYYAEAAAAGVAEAAGARSALLEHLRARAAEGDAAAQATLDASQE